MRSLSIFINCVDTFYKISYTIDENNLGFKGDPDSLFYISTVLSWQGLIFGC